ncbi:hypothetical protein Gpo141_00004194 [Globisporangium polare]
MPMTRSDAVGKRVRVYWADEAEWFSGHVQDVDEEQGYFVLYDDGDERWEASAQLVEFEEGDEQQQQQQQERDDSGGDACTGQQQLQRTGDHAPRMMEPPASPSGAYDDDRDEEYDDDEHKHTQSASDNEGGGGGASGDDADDVERIDLAAAVTRPAQFDPDDDGDSADSDENGDQRDGSDDDGEQSIAMSEVPITFERLASSRNAAAPPPTSLSTTSARSMTSANPYANVNLPTRGVLRGKVLRASHLPSIPSSCKATSRQRISSPRAFVKIAFVEAAMGGTERASKCANNVMLRCKNALASTSVAQPSRHPVWNDSDTEVGEGDGAFQMQLVPPVSFLKEPPAWLQLRGDVLFSVYSTDGGTDQEDEDDDSGRARHVPDFIGQAVLSLRDILQEVLFGASPHISRHLPLQTRQGKPLTALGGNRSRNTFGSDDDDEDDDETNAPEIVVAFEFEPTFAVDIKQRTTKTSRTASQSTRSVSTKDRGLTQSVSSRSLASQPKRQDQQQAKASPSSKPSSAAQAKQQQQKKAPPPSHTSSSNINRRRFEKQIDQQNVAFAKRIEWQDQRRARRSDQAKAQAKSKAPVPQHGSMKLDHKASSSVNRTKFQQQVRHENRAMEKRLHAIILKDEPKSTSNSSCTSGEQWLPKFSDIAFDALDKDELLARDRRQQRLREQDFLEARAQAKYQQQNQVVEEVLKIQNELAELRAQVFNAKAAVTRLDILNNKDQHLCHCLRSAAESAPTAISGSGGGGKNIKHKPATTSTTKDSDVSAGGSASVTRQRKELELLLQEASSLISEKQSHAQELKACNQKQQDLDDQVQKLTSQLRFVQNKQAFQQRMNSRTGGAQAVQQVAKEMKKKAQLLELSSEEEELWALYQAQQELTQLQIAVQVLRERQNTDTASASKPQGSSSSSAPAAACEYLEKKINRQKQKLEQLEQEQRHFQREYEALAVSGTQEFLRKQVHELQQTLFLCQSQQKHARVAQRHTKLADEKLTMELQKQVFNEQTETEILFKKKSNST